MDDNPFVHVPHLKERLIPIAESKVRVTPQVLAQWDVRVRAIGGADRGGIVLAARRSSMHSGVQNQGQPDARYRWR